MDLIYFILTYFVSKDLYFMSAFICWSPDLLAKLWRSASQVGIRIRVYTDIRSPPRMAPYDWHHPEAMLLDLNCPGVDYLLQNVSSSRAFNYRYSWLLLHNASYDRNNIENILEDYEILPDADVVWSAPDNLVDVYRIKAKHPYLLTSFGLARNCSSKDLWELQIALPTTAKRRKNLRNVTMLGSTVVSFPTLFHGWKDMSTRQLDTNGKLTVPLLMLAAEDLNIHYNLRQVDAFGYPTNGSFSGLMGLFQRHEIEIGITSMFMRTDRLTTVHYISEAAALTCAIIFRQPPRSVVSNVFLAPFSPGVWMSCGLVVLSTVVALVLLRRVLQTTHQDISEGLQELTPLTVLETCTFILGTMCQQGVNCLQLADTLRRTHVDIKWRDIMSATEVPVPTGFHVTPPVTSVRLVMFSALLTSLFLFTSYSANIVTLLQMPSTALRTYDDLTRSSLTVSEQDYSYKKVYFAESADPAVRRLYRRKMLPQGERAYLSLPEGIENVRTKLFAFAVERSAAYDVIKKTYTEREKCSLYEIDAFTAPMVSIPMKKYSGYRELFATRLRWQREVGLLDQSRRVWLVSRPKCESQSGDFVSIGITDVLPAFKALAIGAVLAIILLGTELAVHAVKSKTSIYIRRRSAGKI